MRVIVIGAGPAGSLAAILLARGGADVTLIERHRFPRHKVCGECLSAMGREVLGRHDLERPIAAIGVELTRTRLHAGGSSAAFNLPRPMLGISRARLDLALLQAAQAAGVTIHQPMRVEAIATSSPLPLREGLGGGVLSAQLSAATLEPLPPPPPAGGGGEATPSVIVTVRESVMKTVRELHADLAILANGAALFAGEKPAATGDLGIKTHFRNVAADAKTITLYAADGCYGGVAPIEDGRWNAAFSVTADRVRTAGGDVAAVFEALIQSDHAMRCAFAGAERIEPWLAAPLPRFAPRRDWPMNLIPIGNAAAAIEPIGGEGMGLALRSAELAATAILAGRLHELQSQYDQLWRSRRIGCRLAARAMTNHLIGSAGVELMQSPAVAAIAFGMIGKIG